MGHKTKAAHEKLAALIRGPVAKRTMKISEALVQCGYSETQAKRGWDTVPAKVREMVGKKRCTLIEKGRRIMSKPELAQAAVIGRLMQNVEDGKDGGTASAKALGNWRAIDMFTPEQLNGVIVVVPPASVLERKKQLLESDE
jgi:hypothetical protein